MEWLANISIKWVLVGVGGLLVLLAAVRAAFRRRSEGAAALIENIQVVVSVIVVVFLIVRPFLFQAFYIPSSSMEPTLLGPDTISQAGEPGPGGDRLIVNKLIYRIGDPSRLDIVVFRAPPEAAPDEKEYIKRTIGLPGETIEVVPPRLLIDEEVALRLVADGSPEHALQVQKDAFPIRILDNSTELPLELGSAPLKVIAHSDPRVFFDGQSVRVNGRTELSQDGESIQAREGVVDLGGAPEVKATVYSLRGQPRLILLRGLHLEYDPGHVRINGTPLVEPYLKQPPWYAMPPRELGADEYFMMGDNRNSSSDSHVWGPLKRNRMLGRAEVLFWPLNRLKVIHWWLLAVLAGIFAAYQALQRTMGQSRA